MSVATPPTTNRAADAAAPGRGPEVRRRFVVSGVVQGVGFRPFVWNLAHRLGVSGWVCNTSGAVIVEVGGRARCTRAIRVRVARRGATTCPHRTRWTLKRPMPSGEVGFRIVESQVVDGEYQPIAPDAATCADCVADILDPGDRRYRYPFTNCTNCGPRFTIIEDVPYDRRFTTMRSFTMCAACRREYEDPGGPSLSRAADTPAPTAVRVSGSRTSLGAELAGDPIELAVAAICPRRDRRPEGAGRLSALL